MSKLFTGKVIKKSGDKTISVQIESQKIHPIYKKRTKQFKNFLTHDEKNKYNVGDVVNITMCRPISKNKTFTVLDGEKK